MFECRHECLVSGRHVKFEDKQSDSDGEHAIGEGFQAAGGQEAVVNVDVPSRRAGPACLSSVYVLFPDIFPSRLTDRARHRPEGPPVAGQGPYLC